jgi:arylsulfatase A-like enzyme
MLSEAGYATGAVVSGFTLKNRACGLAPRFDRYDDELIAWTWMPEVCARLRLVKLAIEIASRRGLRILRPDRPADETVDAALAWLEQRGDEPWFLWVHCYDPHAPYEPPADFAYMHDPEFASYRFEDWYRLSTAARRALVDDPARLANMRAMYKGEISFVDHEVGRLLAWLDSAGEDENTLIVLTSDHGEGLGEHGYYFDHGTYLYDTELRVPLIVRPPPSQRDPQSWAVFPQRLQGQMRLVDLTPTVLEMLDLETPPGMFGANSFRMGFDGIESRPSLAVADVQGDLSGYDLERHKLSLRMNGYKLIWTSEYWLDTTRVPAAFELYELGSDPLELTNVARKGPPEGSLEASMRAQLETFLSMGAAADGKTELAPEMRERLRELGYL